MHVFISVGTYNSYVFRRAWPSTCLPPTTAMTSRSSRLNPVTTVALCTSSHSVLAHTLKFKKNEQVTLLEQLVIGVSLVENANRYFIMALRDRQVSYDMIRTQNYGCVILQSVLSTSLYIVMVYLYTDSQMYED